MSQTLRPFVDITDAIFGLMDQDFPTDFGGMGTSLDDVADSLPYLRAEHLGGVGGVLQRLSTVDLEVFAPTYAGAVSLSERISAYLLGYPRSVRLGGRLVVLDRVYETRPPVELPWDDSNIRRIASTYQISVRR
jgi:hypothetical protein